MHETARQGNPTYLGVLTNEINIDDKIKRFINGYNIGTENILNIDPQIVHSFTIVRRGNVSASSSRFAPYEGKCVFFLKIIDDASCPKEEILFGTKTEGEFKLTNLSVTANR